MGLLDIETGHAKVDAVLTTLRRGVARILSRDMVGMYLYGSLALGDFDPESSDIDFLIATVGRPTPDQLSALRDMHAALQAGAPVQRIEGSYIPLGDLRRYEPSAEHAGIGTDWPFEVRGHGPDWVINRHIVREHSPVLFGPDPRALIDPVSPAQLRQAVVDVVAFWNRSLEDPRWLRKRNYQAFAVFTMCRMLYTLECGEVVSKPVAAAWASERLDAPSMRLIDRARVWQYESRPGDMGETLTFVRSVLDGIAVNAERLTP